MGTEVKTGELRGYAGLLERNATEIDRLREYVQTWTGKEMQAVNAEGLLGKALTFHDKVYAGSYKVLGQVGQVLRGSAGELRKAAGHYDDTDEKESKRLDQLAGAAGGQPVRRAGWEATASGYKDIRDPSMHIHVEPSVHEVQDWIDKVLNSVTDATSITAGLLRVLEETTGRKPVEELVQFVSGDWEAFSRCADVWSSVAGALEDVAYNIDHGNAAMDHGWDGGASEAAYAYFAQLADALMQLSAKFKELEEGYLNYSKWVMQVTTILADLIKMAFDILLVILTRQKGKGVPLLADAFAALEAVKVVKLIAKFGYTVLAARGTAASRFAFAAFVEFDLFGIQPTLPAKAYDLAGV